jgi:hypothetical protein
VLVLFLTPGEAPSGGSPTSAVDRMLEAELDGVGGFSSGLMSATQGAYRTSQFLLDATQGARVSYSAYSPDPPPALSVALAAGGSPRPAGLVEGWSRARARAAGAPQLLRPGLLAASIPGGAAYAGLTGQDHEDAVLAADEAGRVATLSLGSPATLPARIEVLLRRRSLIVADLPKGPTGVSQLRSLAAARGSHELLIVVQRAPDEPGHELLWLALGGLGGGHELTSQTTNQRGLVAAVDLAPTILGHLGLALPADMRGKPIRIQGSLDAGYLRSLKARLGVLSGRRLPALACLLCAWALLLLGSLCRPAPRLRAWAMRVGGLALLWTPVAVLIPAALEPSAPVEYALLLCGCLLLGALTDRLLTWPRAPIAPALVAVVALSVDALAGTQLLIRSLLGPNPIFGARFYGIGNELKSGLAVLVFTAVAAALSPAVRGRRAAGTMAVVGIALAGVEGSARIGAGVGGVILVSAGTAMAVALLLPGGFDRRRALTVLVSPLVGLLALAVLDLLTAHGSGHFTGSVLHARSAGDVRDIIVRRYRAAWDALKNGAMPYATAFALLAGILGVRRCERLLAPVARDPAWLAALAGGLTAGVVGALTEDSGPVLLVVAVFTLTCVLAYLWGRPPAPVSSNRPRRIRAARSRARTQPGELAR